MVVYVGALQQAAVHVAMPQARKLMLLSQRCAIQKRIPVRFIQNLQ